MYICIYYGLIHVSTSQATARPKYWQVGKANRTLGLIRRPYTYLDETSLTKLYIALLRCMLEYGDPAYRKD